ncbi:hypothetical protein EVAR_51370_1 [Eumeta japonica]|uniref:Uncharacterized protein n=1 Tax=Eumeta variegata TaxID=151549 RepID=A0A4C1Y6R2_EUMVA|nr:hypothetical protein EVAR_51370_1 [Eumeta japonica]
MCIRTVMTYASPSAHAAPKALDRLQVIQNKFCKAAIAVDYEPPHSSHFIRRPQNVLNDPPDALTAAVESLNEINDTHD